MISFLSDIQKVLQAMNKASNVLCMRPWQIEGSSGTGKTSTEAGQKVRNIIQRVQKHL
jgi:hypothetical protein